MKTLVFGYSESADRYSNKAYHLLKDYHHEVVAINPRQDSDLAALSQQRDIHTLTLYINPTVAAKFEKELLEIKPARVIFNPGTENVSLEKKFEEQGAEVVTGCTLVMLRTGQF